MNEKQDIGSLFDRISRTYDRLNHLLSLNIDRRWRYRAVGSLTTLAADEQLLDVAVGTADLTLEVLRQGKAQHVVGIDLSEQMMKIGQEKINKSGYELSVSLKKENAQHMSFADNSFAAVTCAFGVRNFADLDAGLREMTRVLRLGGQMVILEFSYPENKVIAALYDFYFTHILPLIGKMLSHDKTAYTYLNRSVKSFIWGQPMCDKLSEVGLSNVGFKTLTFGIATIYVGEKRGIYMGEKRG